MLKFRPSSEKLSDSAPLTIFYNGTVSIFDVPRDKVCFVQLILNSVLVVLTKLTVLLINNDTKICMIWLGGDHFEACCGWNLESCWKYIGPKNCSSFKRPRTTTPNT